jgi:hypothetical protein
VPGFESARVELYLVAGDEERRGVVALSCGGTAVLGDMAEIDGVDAPREPWSSGRLEGVIDFPDLHVSPGSRRGFTHDEPVAAFLAVLAKLEGELAARLAEEGRRRAEQRREHLARDIRRAFRAVARRLPEYDFFAVRSAPEGEAAGDAAPSPGAPGRHAVDGASADEGEPVAAPEAAHVPEEEGEPAPPSDLFPPGPFARPKCSRRCCDCRRSRRAACARGRARRRRPPVPRASRAISLARRSKIAQLLMSRPDRMGHFTVVHYRNSTCCESCCHRATSAVTLTTHSRFSRQKERAVFSISLFVLVCTNMFTLQTPFDGLLNGDFQRVLEEGFLNKDPGANVDGAFWTGPSCAIKARNTLHVSIPSVPMLQLACGTWSFVRTPRSTTKTSSRSVSNSWPTNVVALT